MHDGAVSSTESGIPEEVSDGGGEARLVLRRRVDEDPYGMWATTVDGGARLPDAADWGGRAGEVLSRSFVGLSAAPRCCLLRPALIGLSMAPRRHLLRLALVRLSA